jgi:gamma-glutamyltranspeptidase/glutathione hydrolase
MDLEDVIQPAIDLAENGFILPEHTARSIKYQLTRFMQFPSSMKVFTKDSSAYEAGDLFIQKDLAFTLKQIRENGKAGLYEGEVADLIVAQMDSMGGLITHEDLKEYEPVERDPVYGTYRGYDIVSMPPPSSGGAALVQMLNVLENFDVEREQWGSSLYIHRLVEAMKRAYADRSKHLGDMDYYDVPLAWLTSKAYGEHIAHQITDSATVSDSLHPGKPYPYESDETTHYSIADKYGNAVSVTTTINFSYGSGLVVEGAGFLLNDEMDDFSAKPNTPNAFGLLGSEANAIEPGKRMLSSMTPTIVLKDNKPYIIIGTPGGATIITVVLQVILNCIDFGMDIQQAINMPRIHHQWKPDEIFYENFGMPIDVKENLIRRGHSIGGTRMLGLAEGIMINHNTGIMFGATDARGNGLAKGF